MYCTCLLGWQYNEKFGVFLFSLSGLRVCDKSKSSLVFYDHHNNDRYCNIVTSTLSTTNIPSYYGSSFLKIGAFVAE